MACTAAQQLARQIAAKWPDLTSSALADLTPPTLTYGNLWAPRHGPLYAIDMHRSNHSECGLNAGDSRQVASSEEARCVPQWPRCATQDMQHVVC